MKTHLQKIELEPFVPAEDLFPGVEGVRDRIERCLSDTMPMTCNNGNILLSIWQPGFEPGMWLPPHFTRTMVGRQMAAARAVNQLYLSDICERFSGSRMLSSQLEAEIKSELADMQMEAKSHRYPTIMDIALHCYGVEPFHYPKHEL